jgi:predicted nucleic acid-binding protein
LDTNIVSYLMEKRPSIVAKVGDVGGPSTLSIPTLALAEARIGVTTMPAGARKARLLAALEAFLTTGIDVRPFSAQAAIVFSEAGAELAAEDRHRFSGLVHGVRYSKQSLWTGV